MLTAQGIASSTLFCILKTIPRTLRSERGAKTLCSTVCLVHIAYSKHHSQTLTIIHMNHAFLHTTHTTFTPETQTSQQTHRQPGTDTDKQMGRELPEKNTPTEELSDRQTNRRTAWLGALYRESDTEPNKRTGYRQTDNLRGRLNTFWQRG